MKKAKAKVKKETNLAELVFRFPATEEVLLDYGLHCVSCVASGFDTIEMGAKAHGMSDAEISDLINRLNEVIEHEE